MPETMKIVVPRMEYKKYWQEYCNDTLLSQQLSEGELTFVVDAIMQLLILSYLMYSAQIDSGRRGKTTARQL